MLDGGWIAVLCSFWINWPEGFEETNRLAVLVKLLIAVGLAFVMFSDALVASVTNCWLTFWGTALDVTVVGAPKLKVVGVGLLLIKLSTNADVTLGVMDEENVLARGGTIGMNGIGWGGKIVCDCGAIEAATAAVVWPSSKGCEGLYIE